MIFRIRFAKYGVVKFIGHLDVMRYFQKAVRRSGLPIKYSQGFNPHQLMVFASPLGVGITSDGEYMDIETEDKDLSGVSFTPDRIAVILEEALTEGFGMVSVEEIPWQEGAKHPENAMSLVNGADYMMSLKDGYDLGQAVDVKYLKEKFDMFLGQESIIVSKKSKSGEKDLDIKPYIFEAAVSDNDSLPDFIEPIGVAHADIYTPGIRLFYRLSAGSAVNIKPELLTEAFLNYIGREYRPFAFQIHRIQMYRDVKEAVSL